MYELGKHYTMGKKQDTKDYVLYDFIYNKTSKMGKFI